jgi:hypothetical protein
MRKMRIRIGLAWATCGGLVLLANATLLSQEISQASSTARSNDEGAVMQLMAELASIGQQLHGNTDPRSIANSNMKQADIILRILVHTHGRERLAWLTQLVDCLHVAAINSPPNDQAPYQSLMELEAKLAREMPGSDLAAYAMHCEMEADHMQSLNQPGADFIKTQENWRKRLAGFVQSYPHAKETPENLMELATVSESLNRFTDARRCYGYLVDNFPDHPLAARARGALRRLHLEGETFRLALPLLYAEDQRYDVPFDIDEFRGKLTVVYFWSSHESQSLQDLKVLEPILDRYHARGLELLCVNLDRTPGEARRFLSGQHGPGTVVFQRGGVDGAAALQYGLISLPTTLLVGKDGKVISRDVQLSTLDHLVSRHLADHPPTDLAKSPASMGKHWPWDR